MRRGVNKGKAMALVMVVTVFTGASADFGGLYKTREAANAEYPVVADAVATPVEMRAINQLATASLVSGIAGSSGISVMADGGAWNEEHFNPDELTLSGEIGILSSIAGSSDITGGYVSGTGSSNQNDNEESLVFVKNGSGAAGIDSVLFVKDAFEGEGILYESITENEEENKDIFGYDDMPEYFKEGITHDAVMLLQEKLMELGFMEYSEPTNYYGSITKSAVMMFQRQCGITEDGVVGAETLRMIFAENAPSYAMKKGMKGDDIEQLQYRLYELGYFASADMLTGYFGDTTEEAVKHFQENNGVTADAVVDQYNIELLYSESVKANILSFGDKSDVVLECQKILKKLGYMYTEPDGMYGSDTLSAVKQFQENNGLTADGYLGPTTLSVLHSDSAVANGFKLGDSGDSITRLQELLKKYGYLGQSSITGYYGTVTESAVRSFQRNNGLTADGIAGSVTINLLTKGSGIVKVSDVSASTQSSSSASSSQSASSSTGTSSTGTASVEKLISVAKSKVGAKYVWGAKGPDRFDCSGFVYWCLNQVGVKQGYITSYGWRSVSKYQKVSNFSDIKAGDIVVVYGHVGIAAGNGMVIDASSSSGKIVYRELGSWWKKNFICAWRIF